MTAQPDVRDFGLTLSIPKLCPFCGEVPGLARQVNGMHLVGCENDDCPVNPQAGDRDLTAAWRKWNRRAHQ